MTIAIEDIKRAPLTRDHSKKDAKLKKHDYSVLSAARFCEILHVDCRNDLLVTLKISVPRRNTPARTAAEDLKTGPMSSVAIAALWVTTRVAAASSCSRRAWFKDTKIEGEVGTEVAGQIWGCDPRDANGGVGSRGRFYQRSSCGADCSASYELR